MINKGGDNLKEIRFEVNKRCNFACVHCYTDKFAFDQVALDEFRGVLKQLADAGTRDLSLTGGEPLLDAERVIDLTRFAAGLGYRVRLNTNGFLLTPDMCERLIESGMYEFQVSLNGPTPAEFDPFVNVPGAFHKVTAGMRTLAEMGSYVSCRFTLMAENAARMVDTYLLCDSLGVRSFKVRTLVQAAHIEEDLSEQTVTTMREAAHTLFKAADSRRCKVRLSDNGLGFDIPSSDKVKPLHCLCGHSSLFITAEGHIVPCPFLRDYSEMHLGNIKTDNIQEVFDHSDKLKAFVGTRCDSGDDHHSSEGHTCACKAADYVLAQAGAVANDQVVILADELELLERD